jgi:hypothetical protein
VGLDLVTVTLVFNFMTQGVRDKDREGVGLWIYEGGLIIGNAGGPQAGEPIICILFAIGVNKLRFNTRD